MPRHLCVNVDLDSLELYFRLHGLDPKTASNTVYDVAVPRFAELFDRCGVKATFFVVASDLELEVNRQRIRELVAAGHEIGNHSWSHPYDLINRSDEEIHQEIKRAHHRLTEVSGGPIVGFRAPGYNVSPAVYRSLVKLGYLYDSSILPSPPYLLAKYAVMAGIRLRGRRSHSIVGNPLQMIASTRPKTRHGVWEIPVTVLPLIRFPFIGTMLTLFGERLIKIGLPLLRRQSLVNLEFHGIDLLALVDDKLAPELGAQSDVKVSLAAKTRLFEQTIRGLLQTHQPVRLDELTRILAG